MSCLSAVFHSRNQGAGVVFIRAICTACLFLTAANTLCFFPSNICRLRGCQAGVCDAAGKRAATVQWFECENDHTQAHSQWVASPNRGKLRFRGYQGWHCLKCEVGSFSHALTYRHFSFWHPVESTPCARHWNRRHCCTGFTFQTRTLRPQFMPPVVSGASGEWMEAGESGVFLINAQGKRVSGDSEGHRVK